VEAGKVPAFTFTPGTAPMSITAEVFGPEAEWVDMAWRFDGTRADADHAPTHRRVSSCNGSAGLIDLNLMQTQKVLNANAYAGSQTDYSELELHGEPKEGQTLEQVRDLLLASGGPA
jgi:hypothetical protein